MTAATQPDHETGGGSVPVIEFVAPMPGFPDDRRYVLVRIDDDGLLYALTSLDSPGLRFLVAPPAPFFPGYAPEIDDETLATLGTSDPADLLLLLVVSAGDTPREATANLMAPIVLDQRRRRGVQLVLGGSGLAVRAPLLVATGAAGAAGAGAGVPDAAGVAGASGAVGAAGAGAAGVAGAAGAGAPGSAGVAAGGGC